MRRWLPAPDTLGPNFAIATVVLLRSDQHASMRELDTVPSQRAGSNTYEPGHHSPLNGRFKTGN